MADEVRRAGAQLGIALDGDADRVILADEKGNVVDGDQIMAILGTRMLAADQLPGQDRGRDGDVEPRSRAGAGREGRQADPHGGRRSLRRRGDARERATLGGEQSGHIIFLDHATTGDGIIAALRVLAVMVAEQKPLSELARDDDALPAGAAELRGRAQAPVRGDARRCSS